MRVATLTVEVTAAGDRSTITLVGELDLDSVDRLRPVAEEQLSSGAYASVSLDMAGLTFVDSSGLALLVELRRLASEAGVRLEIVNLRPGPRRVVMIAGLTETLGLPPP
jgi:anti-anti-sigma factor